MRLYGHTESANKTLHATAARRSVDRFVKREHHHCSSRPAPAAVRELGRSA